MNRKCFFKTIMDICNWDGQDDDAILTPLIDYLAKQPDEEIYGFDDRMAELLYEIDTRKIFKKACTFYPHSDDSFLYARCVSLINGEEYYEKVKTGKVTDLWKMEFESILYVPRWAWQVKHGRNSEYLHKTKFSYETGSNKDGWKGAER